MPIEDPILKGVNDTHVNGSVMPWQRSCWKSVHDPSAIDFQKQLHLLSRLKDVTVSSASMC